MPSGSAACDVCTGGVFDATFGRTLVWEDDRWRLTVSLQAPIVGFSYLEPKRHIPDITQLDGAEARDFGAVLARMTALLRAVTGADLVYALMLGDHQRHLHVNLVPHHPGEPTAGSRLFDPGAPPLERSTQEAFVARLRQAIAAGTTSDTADARR
jgi:diadenosine tetraphosphate (Ap4A) HIT family hydrolase